MLIWLQVCLKTRQRQYGCIMTQLREVLQLRQKGWRFCSNIHRSQRSQVKVCSVDWLRTVTVNSSQIKSFNRIHWCWLDDVTTSENRCNPVYGLHSSAKTLWVIQTGLVYICSPEKFTESIIVSKMFNQVKFQQLLSGLLISNKPDHFIPVWRYATAGLCDSNMSVCLSITRRYCIKTRKASVMISSPSGSPTILVFWCQISSQNLKGHPERGRRTREGWLKSAVFYIWASISRKR